MNSLKLSHRLAAGFAACVLVMVVAGALAVSWLRELSQMQSTMYEKEVVPLRLAGTASWQAATHFRRMYPYILKPDAKSRAETLALNEASGAEILKAVAFAKSNATSDEQKQLVADFDTLWPAYIASTRKVEAAADAGDTQAAMDELNTTTDPLHVKLRKLFIRFAELCEKSAHAQTDNGVALVDGAAWRMLALIVLGIVVTSLAGWRVVVSVVRQIGGEPAQAAELARHVADGDLTARVALRRGDDASIMAAPGRDAGEPRESRGQRAQGLRRPGHRGARNLRRQQRPVLAHRATGERARGDRGVDGAAQRHRAPQRRQRAPRPSQLALGRQRPGRRRAARS